MNNGNDSEVIYNKPTIQNYMHENDSLMNVNNFSLNYNHHTMMPNCHSSFGTNSSIINNTGINDTPFLYDNQKSFKNDSKIENGMFLCTLNLYTCLKLA